MASEPIFIPDNFVAYSKEQMHVPAHYDEDIKSIIIPSGTISDRVEKLTKDIFDDYHDKNLHFLCVLKGGFQFFTDINHFYKRFQRNNYQVSNPFSFDFARVSSYHNTSSTGNVKISMTEDLKNIEGKDVLIIEDIVDTGNSMVEFMKELKQYNPSSVEVASLLVKRTSLSNGFKPKYAGFSVPNEFVVGYGMDVNEKLRDIDHLCIISDKGKEKYSN